MCRANSSNSRACSSESDPFWSFVRSSRFEAAPF